MTELQQVPGTRNGAPEHFQLGRAREGEQFRVWLLDNAGTTYESHGSSMHGAFAALRGEIEVEGIMLYCNGSRINVHGSQMARQSGGSMAYVLTFPRTATRPESVDIFDPSPPGAVHGMVEEQRRWFESWVTSPLEP